MNKIQRIIIKTEMYSMESMDDNIYNSVFCWSAWDY